MLPLVYEELRRLAAARLDREPARGALCTLQPTALVHEAYLRLAAPGAASAAQWNSRGHFFGAAALAMRRILVERARKRIRQDAAAPRTQISFGDTPGAEDGPALDLLGLDEALAALEKHDERKYAVVMLRYFGGLGIDETAQLLGVADMTVKRDWVYARAWLLARLSEAGP
jgi:RNA polymerase sigma factor (TIGR02999 family)